MNTRKAATFAVSIAVVWMIAGAALAQAPSGPPKPGPEHEKLAYLAGKWASEGDSVASPYGPAGKFTFTQDCKWFEGKFALVCDSDGNMMGMAVKSLSVISWDPSEKTYTYFETNTMGEVVFARGTVQGDTWTWNNESKVNGKPVRGRYILKQDSADSATYKFEMGAPGEELKTIMTGKQTRVK
jgi:hypothetical protein